MCKCLDVQRQCVIAIDTITDAPQPREIAEVLLGGRDHGHCVIVPCRSGLGSADLRGRCPECLTLANVARRADLTVKRERALQLDIRFTAPPLGDESLGEKQTIGRLLGTGLHRRADVGSGAKVALSPRPCGLDPPIVALRQDADQLLAATQCNER